MKTKPFTNFSKINGATKEDEAPAVGDHVKAVFLNEGDQGEGMWIKVTEVLPNLNYRGILQNVPITTDLEHGAEVEFDWSHVREVLA